MKESDKERLKLTANLLNIVAAGTIVAGLVTPVFSIVSGSVDMNQVHPYFVGVGAAIAIVVGSGLHWAARRILRGLDQ